MNTGNRTELVSRDTILKMLSKDETGSVSTAETAVALPKGEEYIDLSQLSHGVLKAGETGAMMGNILSRKSVHADTWGRIVAEITAQDLPKART